MEDIRRLACIRCDIQLPEIFFIRSMLNSLLFLSLVKEVTELKKLARSGKKLLSLRLSTLVVGLLVLAMLSNFVQAKEDSADHWLNKAYSLSANGSYQEALQAYDKVLEKDPNN